MFLALAIQLTNYNQSVNKRVVAEMTWDPPIASLFWKKISLRLENVMSKEGKLRARPTNLYDIFGYSAFVIVSVGGN